MILQSVDQLSLSFPGSRPIEIELFGAQLTRDAGLLTVQRPRPEARVLMLR